MILHSFLLFRQPETWLKNQFIVLFPYSLFRKKTDKHTRLYVAMIADLAYICLFCYNALQQEKIRENLVAQ
ncbi:MAG: hypothetical protein IKZ88_05705 [Neisseriaceae bacterium]|nr:hypothetical protein [Neisseriaceae bacterium]